MNKFRSIWNRSKDISQQLLILFFKLFARGILMLLNTNFQHQRLGRSLDLKSQSFSTDVSPEKTPHIAAMHSIEKGVKFNNLHFITGEELCKLRREPEQGLENPQYLAAHNNMKQIRKKFDKIGQQKLYLENKITRLQEQAKKYRNLEGELEQQKNSGMNAVQAATSSLLSKKEQKKDKYYEKESMLQMIRNMNKDRVLFDKRKFDMENYLQKAEKYIQSIKSEQILRKEEDDRVVKVYHKLVERIQQEEKQRSEHLNSLEGRMGEKNSLHNSSMLRSTQIVEIAEQAMTDRDKNEKEWLKVFLSQKFVEKMLKSKIQREMEKFSVVESSFKEIKIATGVADAKVMVEKFLNKESTYGDLLSKIASNEKEIVGLKKQNDALMSSIKENQSEMNLMDLTKISHGDFHHQLKVAQIFQERRKKSGMGQKLLRIFLEKQFKLLQKSQPQAIEKPISSCSLQTKQQLLKSFVSYLHIASKMVDQSSQINTEAEKQSLSSSRVEPLRAENLFRVRPFIRAKSSLEHSTDFGSSQASDHLDAEYKIDYDEQQLPTSQTYEEALAVDEQRQHLMKRNEKFMEELKTRKWEEKKLVIETLVKNSNKEKAVVPVQKKVEANDD